MKKLIDTQKYSECQLVAAINAATFLDQPPVDPESEEYERLVDLTASRTGGAIFIRKAIEYLRLIRKEIEPVDMEPVKLRVMEGRPVQVSIQHPTAGMHAVLLTNGNHRGSRVWNVKRKEFPHERLSWERIRELMSAVPPQCRKAFWYELDPLKVKWAGS